MLHSMGCKHEQLSNHGVNDVVHVRAKVYYLRVVLGATCLNILKHTNKLLLSVPLSLFQLFCASVAVSALL